MAREAGRPWSPFFKNHLIFVNVKASSKNFQTFAVSKDKGLKFYQNISELGHTVAMTPLTVGLCLVQKLPSSSIILIAEI